VVIRDAAVAADYVASWATFYQDQIAGPWPEVVQDVRQDVQAVIDRGTVIRAPDRITSAQLPRLRPPSTTMRWPVMNPAPSEATKLTAWAMSPGVPIRPAGTEAR